ncbi:MAG TPA: hypothetical protein VHM24_04570 [Gemmatimonadaceae bacterium]|nr:hypothetical protein [Gemmatimonadaceae bacterium]
MTKPSRDPDQGSHPGMPRSLKMFLAALVAIVGVIIVIHLTGNGLHGH